MAILESLKTFATGKTEVERRQSAAANLIIRRKARAAAFREKEKQEIRFATEKQKVVYDRKIKALNKPKQFMGPGSGLDYFREQPIVKQAQQQSKPAIKYVRLKRERRREHIKKYLLNKTNSHNSHNSHNKLKDLMLLGGVRVAMDLK